MDAAYYVAGSDGVLSAAEKQQLKRLAAGLRFDDTWIQHHMPLILVDGDSSAKASRTNTAAFTALAVVATAIFLAADRLAFSVPPNANIVTSIIASYGLFAELLLFVAITLFVIVPFRAFFVRRACLACGSVRLAPVERSKKTRALIGAADEFRCLDCAARGNTIADHDSELLHSDCSLADDAIELPLAIVTAITLGLAGAAMALASPVPAMLTFHAWPAVALGAGLLGLSLGVLRKTRRLNNKVLVGVAVSCAVGFLLLSFAPRDASPQAQLVREAQNAAWPDGTPVASGQHVAIHTADKGAAGLWLVYPGRCETDIVYNNVPDGTEAILSGEVCHISGTWYAQLSFSSAQSARFRITSSNTWIPIEELTVRR
jgi:hypothetical protein